MTLPPAQAFKERFTDLKYHWTKTNPKR